MFLLFSCQGLSVEKLQCGMRDFHRCDLISLPNLAAVEEMLTERDRQENFKVPSLCRPFQK